jgi:Mg2+ and Co2+ transporter CorA
MQACKILYALSLRVVNCRYPNCHWGVLQLALVTVRFATLSTFDAVTEKLKQDETIRSAPSVFTALLEAMVDRGADVLERLGAELTTVSKSVFRGDPSQPKHIDGLAARADLSGHYWRPFGARA